MSLRSQGFCHSFHHVEQCWKNNAILVGSWGKLEKFLASLLLSPCSLSAQQIPGLSLNTKFLSPCMDSTERNSCRKREEYKKHRERISCIWDFQNTNKLPGYLSGFPKLCWFSDHQHKIICSTLLISNKYYSQYHIRVTTFEMWWTMLNLIVHQKNSASYVTEMLRRIHLL